MHARFPIQKAAKDFSDHIVKEQQAVALINQGKLQEAEKIYRELIRAGTKNHIVYGNLAAVCEMQGKRDELMELLEKALKINPDYADAHNNRGNALKEQGNITSAIGSYKKAIEFNYNYPDAHYNLGAALQEQGDLEAAISCYNSAIQLKPDYPKAHNNLGNALKHQGNIPAAIASYNQAIEFNKNYPDAHYNLGNALKEQGNITAAIACFSKAIDLKPNYPEAHNNLGDALKGQGNIITAIASFEKALELKPDNPEVRVNLSMAELLKGNYKRSWEFYENRFEGKEGTKILNAYPPCEQWSGEELIKDSRLLLVSEQGLGDTLQFMRYAFALRNQGLIISLCAPPKLHSLIKVSGIDAFPLTSDQANKVTEGKWIPLLSVPRYLGISPKNPILTRPYIKTTDELIAKWKGILSTEQHPIIGINWQGNPSHEKTTSIGRSLPLETFTPILETTNASLLSLQKGFGSEQIETCSFQDRFVSCQNEINETWDFLETAAIIANCDLVITSDTSVAHLAAGMGKTTWLLLKRVPEWRWGLEGNTSFWYPSMRLFRQRVGGNWPDVMKRVANQLQEYFGDT